MQNNKNISFDKLAVEITKELVLNNLKFSKSELSLIDKYAKEENINLWATSSKN